MAIPLLIPGLVALGGVLGIGGITAGAEVLKNGQDNKAEGSALQVILNDDSLTAEQKAVILAAMQNEDVSPIVKIGEDVVQKEYIFVPGDNNVVSPYQQTNMDKIDAVSTLIQVLVPGALCLGGLYLITKGGK